MGWGGAPSARPLPYPNPPNYRNYHKGHLQTVICRPSTGPSLGYANLDEKILVFEAGLNYVAHLICDLSASQVQGL